MIYDRMKLFLSRFFLILQFTSGCLTRIALNCKLFLTNALPLTYHTHHTRVDTSVSNSPARPLGTLKLKLSGPWGGQAEAKLSGRRPGDRFTDL